jgi:hypothetical protein
MYIHVYLIEIPIKALIKMYQIHVYLYSIIGMYIYNTITGMYTYNTITGLYIFIKALINIRFITCISYRITYIYEITAIQPLCGKSIWSIMVSTKWYSASVPITYHRHLRVVGPSSPSALASTTMHAADALRSPMGLGHHHPKHQELDPCYPR